MESAEHNKQQDEALVPFQTFDNKENNGSSSDAPESTAAWLRDALGAARRARGAAQPREESELSDKDRAMLERFRFFPPDRVHKIPQRHPIIATAEVADACDE